MTVSTNSLSAFMSCEKLSRDLYRGQSKDLNTGQVYGGQVLGQAIKAASDTVNDDRKIRSAHAYFIRKGDVNEPIIYGVDRALDGGNVSSRVVSASQYGKQILHLSASYHTEKEGLEYRPDVELPTSVLDNALKSNDYATKHFQANYLDIVTIEGSQKTDKNAMQYWVKTKETLPNQVQAHNSVLAYISDMGLLHSALMPHNLHVLGGPDKQTIIMASIDHAIWFHRPFRADEWFFYDCRVVSTSGERGLSHGSLYTKEGVLFASTSQEGLLRIPR